ncbi:capsular polysaccharide export protein, LipB/KpsS family [Paracraurococcus ruber]|nr:acyl-CoA dehydrogenase family protein [Paracraurococcus ruber]
MPFDPRPMLPGDAYDAARRFAEASAATLAPLHEPAARAAELATQWAALLELGWPGMLVPEAQGGAGGTLLDLAAEVHTLSAEMALLAGAAGLPAWLDAAPAWGGAAPEAAFAALLAATRWTDPFRGTPWTAAEGIAQLGAWRVAEAERRRLVACTGMDVFKRDAMRRALGHHQGAPRMVFRASRALALAGAAGGAVGIWAAVMPAGLPARAARARVGLVRMEDGFVRSAGLGVHRAPAASLVMDASGIHYDPSAESDLERLLASTEFDAALLSRAARLRARLTAAGITKYNLTGAAALPPLPPGRRVILVPGQVEDDAAIRRGGGPLRSNLGLLRAVRAENPDAILLWKPHPDVEAGMRRGRVPRAEAARLADHVLDRVPVAPLYALAAEVHCLSSLTGFEALLRGLRVTCWGQPFYAGWGLTEDRAPPPRRARRLSLDELVAGALILHLRCRDPVTGLPCPPEVLLDRLATGAVAPPAPPRLPAPIRALAARCSRLLAGLGARL